MWDLHFRMSTEYPGVLPPEHPTSWLNTNFPTCPFHYLFINHRLIAIDFLKPLALIFEYRNHVPSRDILKHRRVRYCRSLGNLRLASSELRRIFTTAWAENGFQHIIIHMNSTDVSRFVEICNRSDIAQHIETIAIKTTKPSASLIRKLVENEYFPETDSVVIKSYFSRLVQCSDDYERFVKSGKLFICMERAFQCLRLNQSRSVKIQIWNDKRDLETRFGEGPDFENAGLDDDCDYESLLRSNSDDLYEFSDMVPVRVFLAILRSGVMVQSLDVSITRSLSLIPWTETFEALKRRDNITTDHPSDKLIDSVLVKSIESLTTRNLATTRDLFFFAFNHDPSRCPLQLLLRNAVNLQNLEIYYHPYASDNYKKSACYGLDDYPNPCLSSLMNAVSSQPLERLRLREVRIDADTLVQLLRSVAPTLKQLRLDFVVTYGSRRALESFRLSELVHLKKNRVFGVDYHAHNRGMCTYEFWDLSMGTPLDFGV